MEQLRADDPQWIGGYRLVRRLGSGGMGLVYLGRTAGGRTVAVKRVHADLANDSEFRARFRQEVAAARRVGGRWTAPVFDADTEGPQPWVATGYVAGPSLQAAVREFGPLPPASVRALGAGLAEALSAVHGLGLVHRDVKPSNVLLALDGPRLIDFGITRALDAAVQLTRTGLLVGSPGYLSPEQAQGTAAGRASDVFSLGAVLAFAAAGTPPFGENQAVATLLYRVLHEAPDLGRLDPGLRALVAACMAKNPAERPTTEQVRAGLEADGETARLGAAGWLPPAISASVGRLAVELLDLEADAGHGTAPADPVSPQGFATPVYQPPPQTFAPPISQAPLTAVATMTGPIQTGPMQPSWQTAPLPPASPKRRGPLLAALGAGAVVVVAAIAIAIASSSSSTGTPSSTANGTAPITSIPSRSAPISSSPSRSAASGSIPGKYLGSWQGTATGPLLPTPLAIAVTVAQGHPGDAVGTVTNDGGDGQICRIKTSLVSADAARMVLRVIPNTASLGCVPITDDEVYTLNQDGSMQLALGSFQAELTKQ
ncbi:serine/threonine protein kinase [Catenulispora sp. GP43]|uniref:serine/threonine-protein kinase n=1 Tax=Catenulispora sp. GP43 TaxID=3156263 RepID=UPI0035130507